MRTVAIIPALNESSRLQSVIDGAIRHVDRVIVVDDGSRFPLAQMVAKNDNVIVLRHIINIGKGAALKTGIVWAKKNGFEAAVLIDGDGQHDPHEIPRLLQPLQLGTADIVFGTRKFHGKMPLIARFGNRFLTKAVHFLYRIRVDDTQSGYRALRLSVFDKLSWISQRYAVETEMIVNTGKHHIPFAQVPISTIYLEKYKGTTVIDGIRILINILAWRFL